MQKINSDVIQCALCPELREYTAKIAKVKRRAYRELDYWGRPVPSFGDPNARLLVVGLAPGAHGANRTGRMFTGDSSGNFLFRAMHRFGFASQPESRDRTDGLELKDAWITAAAHCAPPKNRPSPIELQNCRPYLRRELTSLKKLKVVLVLGRVAFESYLAVLREEGSKNVPASVNFAHGALMNLEPDLLCSYHPSQQNTSTGRLSEAMFDDIFATARQLIEIAD